MAKETIFPVAAIPGGEESGHMANAVVTALMELLVAKEVISRGEIIFLLQSLSERLTKDPRTVSRRTSDTLRHWVGLQEQLKKV